MRFALLSSHGTPTNAALIRATSGREKWEQLTPHQGLAELRAGDVALGRLDVLPTIDGVEDGLWVLGALAARGVVILNEASALLAAHDKLLTARLLRRHGISHPETWHLREGRPAPRPMVPVVLKPRFGSWGRGVERCDDVVSFDAAFERVRSANWYLSHGALVQELVPPGGYDLRVVVAAGRVVGAAFRIAAPGEWRTNVALGGVRRAVSDVPREAAELALAAAGVTGAALVGVDLLPDGRGGWIVAELNGAVEFTGEYAMWHDIFGETMRALTRQAEDRVSRGMLGASEGLRILTA